ncbi:MAG TPA: GGDEF domain-containing protein [Candidatus Kapabacteria bacterium]|nr:GGDEF domain-containing protein [Candidatus Kapabacteria bacterium]
MNLDETLNFNGDVDISPTDEKACRFILKLQSISAVTEVWELFLNIVEQAHPGALREAQLAYRAGTFSRALSAKAVPLYGHKNKKKLMSREIDIQDYPFVETGAAAVNEMGYRYSDEEILIFTRTEMHFIQVKMMFTPTPPCALFFVLPDGVDAKTGTDMKKLSPLSRIFLNQMALLIRIENLEFHSIKDDLTTAYNQKYLRGFIQNEIERCKRDPSFFSVVFFDLDNLKAINDRYGHLIGTEVLKEVAYILGHQVRKIDLLSRFGGDEFVIVLLKANPQKAYETCCRIKQKLESTVFLKEKNLNIIMTGCFGISGFPRDGSTVEELIKKADSAMYEVKRRGKNDIKIYEGA